MLSLSKLTGRTLSIAHKRYLQSRLSAAGWRWEPRILRGIFRIVAYVKPGFGSRRSILSAARAAGIKSVPI